jgi:isopenicillin-N N-acyltransferase-like protein
VSIPVLRLEDPSPRAVGEAHGEHFREQIGELYKIRVELTLGRTDFRGEGEVLEVARKHIPIARDFDAQLFEELEGVSAGSGLSLEQLVVLNHYTDLRDLSRAELDDGGCSVIYSPAGVLGQTWDTHGSATDYTCVLDIGTNDERVAMFSITGCLGMTGLSARGLGITINNLNSIDARVGIVWPSLVRRCLRESSASSALALVEQAPLGSGHHYVIGDGDELYGIETSGTKKKVTQQGGDQVHLHTNHCLDEELIPTATVLPTSTTWKRLETLEEMTKDGAPETAADMFRAFAAVSHDRVPGQAHAVATCGAFVMDLRARRALACAGPPGPDVTPTVVEVRG